MIGIKPEDKVFRLKPFQSKFVLSKKRYPSMVSAWGTGKTLSLIALAMRLSHEFPNNLGVIFRKEFTDLKDSTIKDFETYTGIKVSSGREAKVGSSTIMFRHLEEMNNIQNINLGWFGIEQAEELDTDEYFFKLLGRLRRDKCDHKGFIIANTNGHNWIYKLWKNGTLEDSELIEATTFDNKDNLPESYIASLEAIKAKKPGIYNRFVLNSWEESDTAQVIIKGSWVEAAKTSNLIIRPPVRRIVSIDVARGGNDKSVFSALENYKQIATETHNVANTMQLVGLAQIFAKKNKDIRAFAVDEIGVGGGVADRLDELGFEVVFVNAAEREGVLPGYFNRRAEIIGEAARLFEDGKIEILPDDDDLAEQLTWTKWKPIKSNLVLQAESKDDVKERYGRSPDNADCFLNGVWALPRINVAVRRDGYERSADREYHLNPFTC